MSLSQLLLPQTTMSLSPEPHTTMSPSLLPHTVPGGQSAPPHAAPQTTLSEPPSVHWTGPQLPSAQSAVHGTHRAASESHACEQITPQATLSPDESLNEP